MTITKLKEINMNYDEINSPKDFIKQHALLSFKEIGQNRIMEQIEEMRLRKVFNNPEYYSRLKKVVRELCNMPELTQESELINELDMKIRAIKENYL